MTVRIDPVRILLALGVLLAYTALFALAAHADTPTATITTSNPAVAGISTATIAQPLIAALQPYIEDVGGVLFLALSAWLSRHVRNAMLRSAIEAAIQRGAGGVYGALVAQGKSVADKGTTNALVASHTNDILAALPSALKTLGVTPDLVHAMLVKSLGSLLATDPTVTVATPQALQPIVTTKVGA